GRQNRLSMGAKKYLNFRRIIGTHRARSGKRGGIKRRGGAAVISIRRDFVKYGIGVAAHDRGRGGIEHKRDRESFADAEAEGRRDHHTREQWVHARRLAGCVPAQLPLLAFTL